MSELFFIFYLFICFFATDRASKQENGVDSAWRERPLCCAFDNKDKEAEQAFQHAQQVGHEEGIPPDRQGCCEPGEGVEDSFI